MDRSAHRPVILVGVGGSGASLAALHWAVQEARYRDATVRVIQAWQPHPERAPYAAARDGARVRVSEGMAAAHLTAAVRAVVGEQADVDVITELIQGAAERVLAEASAAADLLVLGSATQPPFEPQAGPLVLDRPVGPVIRACLGHARCPVVVIGPVPAADQAVPPAARVRQSALTVEA